MKTIAILAAALSLAAPFAAHAVGLGRLTILSPLGQPLNAEIEVVSLQPGEEDGLRASLAPSEAFRQAGIQASPALAGARFALERRNGRPLIRVTTAQPVSEPFLDLLVELQWNGGRLVREYTVLLDPPEYKGSQAIAAAPAGKAEGPRAEPLAPAESKPQAKRAAADAPAPVASAAASPGTTHEVKPGDTLGAIARRHLPPGVNLNQMLIAIYRANEDAFLRENVNLVRAGRILSIPGADEAGALDAQEVAALVQKHHLEFNGYRARLAAVAASADTASGQQQAVTGTIESKPPTPAPEASQDQLRLAKSDPQSGSTPGARAAQEDDAAARERALQEAQSRVVDLEKNVADLRKLLELKNQQLAELEKRAGTQEVSAAAPGQAEAVVANAATPEPTAADSTAPKPTAPDPIAQEPTAAAPQAPVAAAPQPAKPEPKVAPPPPPAPSLVDEFLENPVSLAGLGAVALLLAGYGGWAWRRKKASQTNFQDSVLGASGAEAALASAESAEPARATGNVPVGGVEAEEVDPIQEADVYMAYGRDAQAEEILKEALQKDGKRVAAHGKLLEIYANRKDARSFEETALKLKALTGTTGPEWDKAAALGRSVDPGNGVYGGAAVPAVAAVAGAGAASAAVAAVPAIDFDLGGASTDASAPDISLDALDGKNESPAPALDFDLGAVEESVAGEDQQASDFTPEGTLIMQAKEPESTLGGLDFDLGLGEEKTRVTGATAATSAPASAAELTGGLDFDLNLDLGESAQSGAEKGSPVLDLSDISLDLGSAGEPTAGAGSFDPASADPRWQEVATKLDLAKAYEEMGDKHGARELLNEVVKDGDPAQKGQAEHLLAKLT